MANFCEISSTITRFLSLEMRLSWKIMLKFLNFLRIAKSLQSLGNPVSRNNNVLSFLLWRKEAMAKDDEVSTCFVKGCRTILFSNPEELISGLLIHCNYTFFINLVIHVYTIIDVIIQ